MVFPAADCLTEEGTFYGSDFLSTTKTTAASPRDCCAACKLATDCTVWNWCVSLAWVLTARTLCGCKCQAGLLFCRCGDKAGCSLPPNLATAGGKPQVDFQTCLWKPRPVNYAGTLPEPPTTNSTPAFAGWTSGSYLFILHL